MVVGESSPGLVTKNASVVALPTATIVLVIAAAAIIGAGLAYLIFRTRTARLEERLHATQTALRSGLEEKQTLQRELHQSREDAEQRGSEVAALRSSLTAERDAIAKTARSLSTEALKENREAFLALATETLSRYQAGARGEIEQRAQAIEALVKPVNETLGKLDTHVRELERTREGAYAELRSQLLAVHETQTSLQGETRNLVTALRSPTVRGQWGEIQLKRVVQLAGIETLCEFQEQIGDEETRRGRPDLIVHMPGGRSIIIDAKAPLGAYLDAVQTGDPDITKEKLAQHARQVRAHATSLSQKGYWKSLDGTPEFVILFLPGEHFLGAALDSDPSLLDDAAQQHVIVATPTMLIGMLRAIHFGWREEQATKRAREVWKLGETLHQRVAVMADHLFALGANLAKSVDAYNKAIASLESRVLVTARKFKEYHVTSNDAEIVTLKPVERIPLELSAPELASPKLPAFERPQELQFPDDLN